MPNSEKVGRILGYVIMYVVCSVLALLVTLAVSGKPPSEWSNIDDWGFLAVFIWFIGMGHRRAE